MSVTSAYIPDRLLLEGWYENTSQRNSVSEFLGLEQTLSVTYEVQGEYPASLTVMTLKTLVLLDEEELQQKTLEMMNATLSQGIQLNNTPKTTGERLINKSHMTMYFVYSGVDTSVSPAENVHVIGEVWNCQTSGTSIICIGVAYVTHTLNNTVYSDLANWKKMVMDPWGSIDGLTGEDGLLDHVVCHQ